MRRPPLTAALILALLAAPALAGSDGGHGHGGHAGAMEPGHAELGTLTVSGAHARASIGAAPTSAVYLTVSTDGASDRLIGAASPAAQATEVHRTLMDGGVMTMAPISGVAVTPDADAVLEPGGAHVMLIGLTAPLEEGDMIELTLTFETAGEVTLMVPVGAPGTDHGH